MEILVILAIYGVLAFVIAHFLGRKRQIGFGWSFFFCFFLNPIVGFIASMLSRKYNDTKPEPSYSKKVWGFILICFSLFAISRPLEYIDASTALTLLMYIGSFGLGYYLIKLGKGRTFNTEALTKTDE